MTIRLNDHLTMFKEVTMRALIIYDSFFGNTGQILKA